jgi:transcriptional regulator with XRE-family HTH domain
MTPAATERGFGTALKGARKRSRRTQEDLAKVLDVSRATIAQWETSRHLPSPEHAERLDAILGMRGALSQLAGIERDPDQPAGAAPAPMPGEVDMLSLLRRVDAALFDHMSRDEAGEPLGWCQNLQERNEASAVSTAFGIKTALLIDDIHRPHLGILAQRLHDLALPDGGWKTSTQSAPRPEAISVVVEALFRLDCTSDFGPHMDLLERTTRHDRVVDHRPAILSSVLETVLDVRPDSRFTAEVVRKLLDSRRAYGPDEKLLWPEKAEPDLASPEPYVAHTARAVCALSRALHMSATKTLTAQVEDALEAAVDWLGQQSQFRTSTEILVRDARPARETLFLRYFNSSWVARALLLTDQSLREPALLAALADVWSHFSPEHGLWYWPNGDLPVWMQFDGVATARLYALAACRAPVGP